MFVQASDDVCKTLAAIKLMLYGTPEQEPQTEHVSQLAMEMYQVSGKFSVFVSLFFSPPPLSLSLSEQEPQTEHVSQLTMEMYRERGLGNLSPYFFLSLSFISYLF